MGDCEGLIVMDKLLTIEQVADFLQVKQSTIYAWIHQQYIPYVKVGRLVRFQKSRVEKWLEDRERGGRLSKRVKVKI